MEIEEVSSWNVRTNERPGKDTISCVHFAFEVYTSVNTGCVGNRRVEIYIV